MSAEGFNRENFSNASSPSDLMPWLEIWPQRLQVWSQSDAVINWTVFIRPGVQIVGTSNRAEGPAMLDILLRGVGSVPKVR